MGWKLYRSNHAFLNLYKNDAENHYPGNAGDRSVGWEQGESEVAKLKEYVLDCYYIRDPRSVSVSWWEMNLVQIWIGALRCPHPSCVLSFATLSRLSEAPMNLVRVMLESRVMMRNIPGILAHFRYQTVVPGGV